MPGPGRVAWDGLQQSIATRDPNFEPRSETMCFLLGILVSKHPAGRAKVVGVPDMAGDQFTLMNGPVHQDPLDKVVAILVPGD